MCEPNFEWWGHLLALLDAEEKRMKELHAFIRTVVGGSTTYTSPWVERALEEVEHAFKMACFDIYALGYRSADWEGWSA